MEFITNAIPNSGSLTSFQFIERPLIPNGHLLVLTAAAWCAHRLCRRGIRWPAVLFVAAIAGILFDRTTAIAATGYYEFLAHWAAVAIPLLLSGTPNLAGSGGHRSAAADGMATPGARSISLLRSDHGRAIHHQEPGVDRRGFGPRGIGSRRRSEAGA